MTKFQISFSSNEERHFMSGRLQIVVSSDLWNLYYLVNSCVTLQMLGLSKYWKMHFHRFGTPMKLNRVALTKSTNISQHKTCYAYLTSILNVFFFSKFTSHFLWYSRYTIVVANLINTDIRYPLPIFSIILTSIIYFSLS